MFDLKKKSLGVLFPKEVIPESLMMFLGDVVVVFVSGITVAVVSVDDGDTEVTSMVCTSHITGKLSLHCRYVRVIRPWLLIRPATQ